MFLVSPPTKVSSISTGPASPPPILNRELFLSARRILPSMNHADFWVIFKSRASSWELTPFLQFTTSQIAMSHLSSVIGESSKIVPALTLYCLRQERHLKMRRV